MSVHTEYLQQNSPIIARLMVEQYSQYGTVPRCTKIGKHNYTLEFDIFLKNKHLKNEIYIRVTTYIGRFFFLAYEFCFSYLNLNMIQSKKWRASTESCTTTIKNNHICYKWEQE